MKNIEKIIRSLSKYPIHGLIAVRLSSETGIALGKLRVYLKSYPDFFVFLKQTNKHTLNRFGIYKGCPTKMIDALIKDEMRIRMLMKGSIILLIVSIVSILYLRI